MVFSTLEVSVKNGESDGVAERPAGASNVLFMAHRGEGGGPDVSVAAFQTRAQISFGGAAAMCTYMHITPAYARWLAEQLVKAADTIEPPRAESARACANRIEGNHLTDDDGGYVDLGGEAGGE